MKSYQHNLAFSLLFFFILNITGAGFSAGQGTFYREHWAEWSESFSNHHGRLRVNDRDVSLDARWGKRPESLTNGLMLVNVPEDLFLLNGAELNMELWGGHPETGNKQFILNGKQWYYIPKNGTEEGHCTYSYPSIPIHVGYLVNGVNAFQFTCERGSGFWGHFIIDNAAVRCFLNPDHPDLTESGFDKFTAEVEISENTDGSVDRIGLELQCPDGFEKRIMSVDYFGRYYGFDDNGDGVNDDWHGFTFKRKNVNHIGTSNEPPYEVTWDTSVIPDQSCPMAVKAVIRFDNGIQYRSPIRDGIHFQPERSRVVLFLCEKMPVPFWSRASREKKAIFRLPENLDNLERAVLMVKVWDGGEGTVKEPFTINGHPYSIVSGKHIHDVVTTFAEVDKRHLKPGENEIKLLSDTEHHGIEVLLPGPCLVLRFQ